MYLSDETRAEIVDIVRHQWKMYQLEDVPESMYLVKIKDDSSKVCSTLPGNNYWALCIRIVFNLLSVS